MLKSNSKQKSFWFNITDDYRSGRNIDVFSNDYKNDGEYDVPEEACEIEFEIPEQGIRVFIVNEFPQYKYIWFKDYSLDIDYENIYLKIFSEYHNFMPFKVTGYNEAYKQLGEYPVVPKNIKNMVKILPNKIKKNINDDYDGYYFIFILDNKGDELYTGLLNPI